MSLWYKHFTEHLTTRYNAKVFGLILKGLFVLLEEIIKKGVVYLSDFLRIIVFPAHPLLKHMGVKGGGALVTPRQKVMIDWGHKRQKSKCVALNLQPSLSLILNHTGRCHCLCSTFALWASKFFFVCGNVSYFNILIVHYWRRLLRATFTARHALTRMSDCTPLLHVMYECMRWTYFSLPRHHPQRRLLKKNLNYPRETTGPCQARAEGRRKSGERQRKRGAGRFRERWNGDWKDAKGRCLTVLPIPCTPPPLPLSG